MDRPDIFERLCGAISNLQDILYEMGPRVELAEIKLKPNRDGGFQFEKAVKSCPSFPVHYSILWNRERPPGVLVEVMEVKITHMRT